MIGARCRPRISLRLKDRRGHCIIRAPVLERFPSELRAGELGVRLDAPQYLLPEQMVTLLRLDPLVKRLMVSAALGLENGFTALHFLGRDSERPDDVFRGCFLGGRLLIS